MPRLLVWETGLP